MTARSSDDGDPTVVVKVPDSDYRMSHAEEKFSLMMGVLWEQGLSFLGRDMTISIIMSAVVNLMAMSVGAANAQKILRDFAENVPTIEAMKEASEKKWTQ